LDRDVAKVFEVIAQIFPNVVLDGEGLPSPS
jgi:hypothetical protein